MNTKRQANIAASVRGDMLSVRLGHMTKEAWNRLYDEALAEGVEMPDTFAANLAAFRQSA